MTSRDSQYYTLEELCFATDLPPETVLEIVEEGILEPAGHTPQEWTFTTHMIVVTKKACRLHADLGIDWAGIALAISLLEEMENLRAENRQLQQQLRRFDPSD